MPLPNPLRNPWTHLRQKMEDLRTHLRQGEREEERGGDRRWTPQTHLQGSEKATGRDTDTGSPVNDEAWPHLPHVPTLTPRPHALRNYEAGQVWDITPEFLPLVSARTSRGPFLVGVGLAHCRWSTRQLKTLEKIVAEGAGGVALQCGDRLQKVYFRDIQVGELHLTFSTFPTLLLFDYDGAALTYRGLTFDPLDHQEERSQFLAGEKVVPAGGEVHFVSVCRGMMCSRLDRSNHWKGDMAISLSEDQAPSASRTR